jgi:hypothetical protein
MTSVPTRREIVWVRILSPFFGGAMADERDSPRQCAKCQTHRSSSPSCWVGNPKDSPVRKFHSQDSSKVYKTAQVKHPLSLTLHNHTEIKTCQLDIEPSNHVQTKRSHLRNIGLCIRPASATMASRSARSIAAWELPGSRLRASTTGHHAKGDTA